MSDSTTRQETQSALNLTLQGIAGSPGISIGKAYLVEQESVEVVEKRFIENKNIPGEVKRFRAAVKKAQKQLKRVIDDVPQEFRDHVYILDAHMMLLKDKMINEGTIKNIKRENINAE
ncbi:MAG: phosphoenolpyruvate--protein phosphotransferase, partial [Deltaproteobacteria bacterium]|nr:phosphoenolpyruvate--protein phosphotransferase [Deltaproteobacteria bacterium]